MGRWRSGLAAVLALSCAVLARAEEPAPAGPGSGNGPGTWFTQTLAYTDLGLNVGYFWSKGAKLRAETVIAGRLITTIVSGDTYYAYDVVGQNGIAVTRSPKAIARDARGERPFGREFENIVALGGERVREETVMGRLCDVFRLTDSVGRREIWVTKDELRLTIRAVVFRRDTGKTMTTDFINWLTGLSIADGFFEPPPGAALERMDYQTYLQRTAAGEAVGPVPILYTDLLVGR
jgi:outer membrane lipoprotein-sorting protein